MGQGAVMAAGCLAKAFPTRLPKPRDGHSPMHKLDSLITSHEWVHRVIRYGIATLISAAVSVGLPILLHEVLGLGPQVSVAIGFVTIFVVNFVNVKYFVFRKHDGSWRQLRRFVLATGGFRLLEYCAFSLLFSLFGLHYVLSLCVVLAASLALKFLVYQHFIFK